MLELKLLCVSEPVTSKPQSIHITDFFRALFQQDTISDGITPRCPTEYLSLLKPNILPPPVTRSGSSRYTHMCPTSSCLITMLFPMSKASKKGYKHGNLVPIQLHLLAVAGSGAGTVPGCLVSAAGVAI